MSDASTGDSVAGGESGATESNVNSVNSAADSNAAANDGAVSDNGGDSRNSDADVKDEGSNEGVNITPEMKATLEKWSEIVDSKDHELNAMARKYNNDPAEVLKALHSLRAEVSKRGLKKDDVPKPEGDDAALAQWRKDNGIPESPEDYTLPEGLSVGDEDKPIVDEFLKTMHEADMKDGVPEKVLDWYYNTLIPQQAEKEAAEIKEQDQHAESVLREKFGRDYTAKMNMFNKFLGDRFGEPFAEAVKAVPEHVEAFINIITELDPDLNMATTNAASTENITNRLAEIEKKYAVGSDDWYLSKNREVREEYGKLIASATKMGLRKY